MNRLILVTTFLFFTTWANLSDIRIPESGIQEDCPDQSEKKTNSTESDANGSGDPFGQVVFQLNLDWNTLWKKGSTLEEVTEEFRREIFMDRLYDISSVMLAKFGRPETKEYNIIMTQDNMVVVEYPLLKGMPQGELEELTKLLLMTYTVQTVPAVYVDQQRLDLFGTEAERAKKREQRRLERNQDLDEIRNVDEMRYAKEFEEEHRAKREYNALKKERQAEREARKADRKQRKEERKSSKEKERLETKRDLERIEKLIGMKTKEVNVQEKKLDEMFAEFEETTREFVGKLDDFFAVSDDFGNNFGKDERILDWHMQSGQNSTQSVEFPDVKSNMYLEL